MRAAFLLCAMATACVARPFVARPLPRLVQRPVANLSVYVDSTPCRSGASVGKAVRYFQRDLSNGGLAVVLAADRPHDVTASMCIPNLGRSTTVVNLFAADGDVLCTVENDFYVEGAVVNSEHIRELANRVLSCSRLADATNHHGLAVGGLSKQHAEAP